MREVVEALRFVLGEQAHDPHSWADMNEYFSMIVAGRHDEELAETFFNSASRRIFGTAGVSPGIEFLDFRKGPAIGERSPLFRRYYRVEGSERLIREILDDLPFRARFEDIARDARLGGARLDAQLEERGLLDGRPMAIELLDVILFRNKGAYLVGRIRAGRETLPLALPLEHPPQGVRLDAVLTRTPEVSIVLSFTRSYFHVDTEQHRDVIGFLSSILPEKPLAELYTSLGYHKHGKTLLYRDLRRHLAESDEQFVVARGAKGLVMEVFTLPSYDVVFKVIRDRFPYPKKTTRQRVMDSYKLVHRHDRVGRLVEAQEFEKLKFHRRRFDPEFLERLLKGCSRTCSMEGDDVVIGHLYTERRVTPLDIYVKEASPADAEAAVVDYGFAIKDLAAAGIFPGDLLLKNFGVTRNRRAVFYDYDEISLLSDCRFRRIPEARHIEDEMSDEPWFRVNEGDIFPEEFVRFLGLSRKLREVFTAWHADLFDVDFWQEMQERVGRNEMPDVIPYWPESRLHS